MFIRRWLGLERASRQVGALRKHVDRTQEKIIHDIKEIKVKLDFDEKIIELARQDVGDPLWPYPIGHKIVGERASWLSHLVEQGQVMLINKELPKDGVSEI